MAETHVNIGAIAEPWAPASQSSPRDPLLRNWLLNTGSLTERLQSHCRRFEVQVLSQQINRLSEDETQFLFGQFQRKSEKTQVREVFLQGNGENWVFARSLLPMSFLEEEMAELTELGTRPLGKIIFNDPRFERQNFQLVECPPEGDTQRKLSLQCQFSLWGRRSLFRFKQHHIMVAEVFLPGAPAYTTNT